MLTQEWKYCFVKIKIQITFNYYLHFYCVLIYIYIYLEFISIVVKLINFEQEYNISNHCF